MLQQEYRPDRQFVLLPLDRPILPSVATTGSPHSRNGTQGRPRLVRRIFSSVVELSSRTGLRPAAGPFIISGRWWEKEAERHYYYAYRGRQIVWIYYDTGSERWMMQGTVE